jgi:hypothetical protein
VEDDAGGRNACATVQVRTATVPTNHTSTQFSLPVIPTPAEVCEVGSDPFTDYVTVETQVGWDTLGDTSHGATPWDCDNKAAFIATATIIHVQIYVGELLLLNCTEDGEDSWVIIGNGYVNENNVAVFYVVNVPSSLCYLENGGDWLDDEIQAFVDGGNRQTLIDIMKLKIKGLT